MSKPEAIQENKPAAGGRRPQNYRFPSLLESEKAYFSRLRRCFSSKILGKSLFFLND